MDERAGYIKKRNILLALLLCATVIAVMIFVFSTAGNRPEAAEPVEEPAPDTAWRADVEAPEEENRLAELLGDKRPTGEAIVLYYGELQLGVSDGTVDPAALSAQLDAALDGRCTPDQKIEARCEKTSDYPVSFDALLNAAADAVLDEETTACGLYVNGALVGAANDEETAKDALSSFLTAVKSEQNLGSNSTVELRNVSYRTLNTAKRSVMNRSELAVLIARTCNEDVTISGVDYARIREYMASAELPSEELTVRTVVKKNETVAIPFGVQYEYDDSKPDGFSTEKRAGVDGTKTYTYEIVYENGKQISKEKISEAVVQQPVDRIIVRGVKQYLLWPLSKENVRVTSPYGGRIHPITGVWSGHTGVDLAGPASGDIKGDPIYAAMDGTVTTAVVSRSSTGYGTYVIIDHGERLISGKNVSTLYAHCNSITVKAGQAVKKGQVIGYVGSTGASTGPHLHFEVRVNGSMTDPLTYMYTLSVGGDPLDPKKFTK